MKLSTSRLLALAVVSLRFSACDAADTAGEPFLDELPLLEASADARIGDFQDPEVGFSLVTGVDVDAEGRVYVLEGSVPEIRVYDMDGTVLRRIGRRGEGPGEFQRSLPFGVVGDTIWTFDFALNRITLFDLEGRLLSTGRTEGLSIPLPNGYGFALPWRMRPDGRFTSRLARISFLRDEPPTGVRPTDSIPVPIVLFDASGRITDTIGSMHRPPPRMWRPPAEEGPETRWIQVAGERRGVPNPPTTLPWWETTLDGWVEIATPLAQAADRGEIRLTRFGLQSDTIHHSTLLYRPERYPSAELDSIAARAARGMGAVFTPMGGGTPPVPENVDEIARALRAAMDFPPFRLPVQTVRLSEDESVWLRLTGDAEATAEWVVIDPEGEARGRLELPAGARVMWHRGEVFWTVEPDEYDVPWLVRYRIGAG